MVVKGCWARIVPPDRLQKHNNGGTRKRNGFIGELFFFNELKNKMNAGGWPKLTYLDLFLNPL
jgi:hypothetical protein